MAVFTVLLALVSPTTGIDDLSWMAGHWLECSPSGAAAETWTDGRGGVMLGVSKSVRGDRTNWELSRIDRTPEGVTFFTVPKGQQPAAFRAKSIARDRVVFENLDHDFPQRVIYTRNGDQLTGRIEGTIAGAPKSAEWQYRRAVLNAVCPVR